MTETLPHVRAVVFDKDGTLVDVEATWGPSMAAALSAIVPDPDLRGRAAAAIGVELESGRLAPEASVIAESNAQTCARLAPILGRRADDVERALDVELAVHFPDHLTPLDGVQPLLARLRAEGIWVGLATNDGERSTREQLELLGWLDAFDSVIGYDSGYGEKPGPGMVVESVRRAGVSAAEVVMVGDTDTDLGAAHAAGCRSVLVHAPVNRITPTVRIDALAELPGVLGL